MPLVRLVGGSSYPRKRVWFWPEVRMGFDKHGIEVDGDCIWLLDAGGQRLCDLTEMQLLDFGV